MDSIFSEFITKMVSSNNVAFDIGANHGSYSIEMAKKYKKVYAFEPHPSNIQILKDRISGHSNIEIITKAISNVTGTQKLYTCANPGGFSISQIVADRAIWGHNINTYIEVPTITIDEFVSQLPEGDVIGFIKMDIEGAENYVWTKAVNTLTKFKPIIHLELHDTINCEALEKFFRNLGYTPSQSFIINTHVLLTPNE